MSHEFSREKLRSTTSGGIAEFGSQCKDIHQLNCTTLIVLGIIQAYDDEIWTLTLQTEIVH